jgi:hypothetical protein
MGSPVNEPAAESILAYSGIAPRNGWIADYPLTPDIIAELRIAVRNAADSGMLALRTDEALKALDKLTISELGSSLMPDTSAKCTNAEPPSYGDAYTPEVVNNYYESEGPPVVTYYPPPSNYYPLYAWVPSPFWSSRFFFPGFFILHDFHKVITTHRNWGVVSNHVHDPRSMTVFVIDPVKRFAREHPETDRNVLHSGTFPHREAQKKVAPAFEFTRGRTEPENGSNGASSTLRDASARHSNSDHAVGRDPYAAHSMRSFENPGRSSGTRSGGGERAFSSPSTGGSVSCGGCHRGGGSSGGFRSGGSSGSSGHGRSASAGHGGSSSGGGRGGR